MSLGGEVVGLGQRVQALRQLHRLPIYIKQVITHQLAQCRWAGSKEMGWLNADGLAQKRWAGSKEMSWLKRDELAQKRWSGSKEMGWL